MGRGRKAGLVTRTRTSYTRAGGTPLYSSTPHSRVPMLGRSHFNTGYAKQRLAFGRTGKARLPYHRYRYTNVTGGNTTASMQQANHSLLRTVGQGVRQTGRVIKHGVVKTGKAFKKAAGKTGKWIKKHKTGIALSALTSAGIGGVSGGVHALSDHNAVSMIKSF